MNLDAMRELSSKEHCNVDTVYFFIAVSLRLRLIGSATFR